MKKTSRRNFGKLMTGAIAAIPAISLAPESVVLGQRRGEKSQDKICIRSHESTPPPISIEDGSLKFTVEASTADPLKLQSGGPPWVYEGDINSGTDNEIAHIRVLHGSGSLLFQDLEAEGSTVTVHLRDTSHKLVGQLVFSKGSGSGSPSPFRVKSEKFGTTSQGDGMLMHQLPSGTGSHKNRHSFQHKGGDTNNEFRVTRIEIEKPNDLGGTDKVFTVSIKKPAPTDEFFSHELRVLIWLKERP